MLNKSIEKNIKKQIFTRNGIIISFLLIISFIVLYLTIANEGSYGYVTGVYITILYTILFALSLNIIVGVMGQLSLGHAGFIAIGAYTAAFLTTTVFPLLSDKINFLAVPEVQLIVATLLAGLVTGIFGLILGLPTIRLKGDYLAIITLAFGEIVRYVIENLDFIGGASGIKNVPQISKFPIVYIIVAVSVVVMALILTSRFGNTILSIRENEIAAESIGISINKVKIYGFVLSGIFAGIAGSLFAHTFTVVEPSKFNFMFSVEILVIVVLGGLGSMTGSVISAVFITVLNEILRNMTSQLGGNISGGLRYFIYSLILVCLMIFRPKGIFGTNEFSISKIINKFKRKESR